MMLYQYVAARSCQRTSRSLTPHRSTRSPRARTRKTTSRWARLRPAMPAIVGNVEHVLALEALCAGQGLDFRLRTGLRPGAGVAEAHALVRETVDHLEVDRDPQPDIAAALDLVRDGRLAACCPAQTLEVVRRSPWLSDGSSTLATARLSRSSRRAPTRALTTARATTGKTRIADRSRAGLVAGGQAGSDLRSRSTSACTTTRSRPATSNAEQEPVRCRRSRFDP